MKRTVQATALTMLLSPLGVFLAPTPVVLADSVEGEAIGVEYSSSPKDTNYQVHNGVAQNSLDSESPYPLFVTHVANAAPLCAETLAFYSKSQEVPPKQKLPVGIDRAFIRFASHPYQGTPIVYVRESDAESKVNNAVFNIFVKQDGSTITRPRVASQLSRQELKAGTLYIDHYNMVQGSFQFEGKVARTGVVEIHLMKDIPQCPFKK